ncbi:Uncharacterised protein [Mycobacteroides abscessus subsp. abscessus]|nr:Uncharacterised protein [Mycobacteroides abscessus subsp. abscessus]
MVKSGYVDHDGFLGSTCDDYNCRGIGIGVFFSVRNEWRYEDIVAGLSFDAYLFDSVVKDELRMATLDINCSFRVAVMVVG